jgi:hypothetical protein
VVANLRQLIGAHPDVTALTLLPELRELARDDTYTMPPMLRSSWALIVGASVERPELVPPGSYADRIAERTLGSGAWLRWRVPDEALRRPGHRVSMNAAGQGAPVPAIKAEDVTAAIRTLRDYVSRVDVATLLQGAGATPAGAQLTDRERAVLMYFATTTRHADGARALLRAYSGVVNRALAFMRDHLAGTRIVERARDVIEAERGIDAQLTAGGLVRSLGIPAAALERALVSAAAKIERATPDGSAAERPPK